MLHEYKSLFQLFVYSVDQAFQDRLKYYINSSVADDIDTMSSAAPGLNKLKGILTKEVESTHK